MTFREGGRPMNAGPWRAVKTPKDGWFVVDRGRHNVLYGLPDAQLEANARLIAAAPDLLAALILCRSALNEEVLAAGDLDHPIIRAHAKAAKQAEAAIAKAEGAQ